jgi:multicomponent Na+:H+ antiporter subunit D
LAKALLFICICGPERDGLLDSRDTGLVSRYPVSAFGFLFGALAMLGVPPTLGFLGRWRLYETALQLGPVYLMAFLISSVFALIAYVLAFTHVWWGPTIQPSASLQGGSTMKQHDPARSMAEPLLLRVAIVSLVVLLLGGGLWPAGLDMLQGGRP